MDTLQNIFSKRRKEKLEKRYGTSNASFTEEHKTNQKIVFGFSLFAAVLSLAGAFTLFFNELNHIMYWVLSTILAGGGLVLFEIGQRKSLSGLFNTFLKDTGRISIPYLILSTAFIAGSIITTYHGVITGIEMNRGKHEAAQIAEDPSGAILIQQIADTKERIKKNDKKVNSKGIQRWNAEETNAKIEAPKLKKLEAELLILMSAIQAKNGTDSEDYDKETQTTAYRLAGISAIVEATYILCIFFLSLYDFNEYKEDRPEVHVNIPPVPEVKNGSSNKNISKKRTSGGTSGRSSGDDYKMRVKRKDVIANENLIINVFNEFYEKHGRLPTNKEAAIIAERDEKTIKTYSERLKLREYV